MRIKNLLFSCLLFLSLFAFIQPFQVSADIGPKNSMTFNLEFTTEADITLLYGEQLQCDDKNCDNFSYIKSDQDNNNGVFLSFSQFACDDNICTSRAYSYQPYQKIILHFSDRTRESQIFEVESGINSNYKYVVNVTDTELEVEAKTNPVLIAQMPFLVALSLTLLIELSLAAGYLYVSKRRQKLLVYFLVANLISILFVWFVFPLLENLNLEPLPVLLLSELFAVVFEALFIYFMTKKAISIRILLLLSLILNISSVLIGALIFTII